MEFRNLFVYIVNIECRRLRNPTSSAWNLSFKMNKPICKAETNRGQLGWWWKSQWSRIPRTTLEAEKHFWKKKSFACAAVSSDGGRRWGAIKSLWRHPARGPDQNGSHKEIQAESTTSLIAFYDNHNNFSSIIQMKLRSLDRDIQDLHSEFETERCDYLETIRRQEQQLILLHQIIVKVQPLIRKDSNYGYFNCKFERRQV